MHVEKFIGDAVMAVFGVPAAHEDGPDPSSAPRSGWRAVRGRERPAHARSGVTLQIRMGVDAGEVITSVDPEPGGRWSPATP